MKGFLINPEAKEITEIEVNKPILKSLDRIIDCDCVDALYFHPENIIWVDDEGFFKPNCLFRVKKYPQPLAGKGVVLGLTKDGDNKDTTVTLEYLKEIISF